MLSVRCFLEHGLSSPKGSGSLPWLDSHSQNVILFWGWGELTSIFNPICSSSQHATTPTPAPPQHQEGRNPRTFEEADKYEQRKIIFLTLTILPVCTEHLGGGRGCAFRPLGWCSLTAGSERHIVKASNSELPPFLKYTGLAGGEKDFS